MYIHVCVISMLTQLNQLYAITSLCFSSPFYKADFCSPKVLADKEDGGIAVMTGRQVSMNLYNCMDM